MATELAVGYVTLLPSMKGFQAAVDKALGKTAASSPAQKTGGRIGDKLISGIGKSMKAGAAVAGGAALAGIGTALVKGFQRLDALDKARASLTGLGHDTKTVQQIMDNALASVKGTAFGMGEAATSAAGAVAAGVKPGKELERTLKLVADASTIAGTDMGSMGAIFNKVAASNKVQMDVINQLHDAGVPALSLLADEMGVTAEEASKMASAGKIDFETFQNAMESGLGGAAMQSGKTFSGAMDNTVAALGRLGAAALGGVFENLKGGFAGVTEWLDSLGPMVEQVGADFGKWAASVIPQVIAGLKTTGEVIANVSRWIGDNIGLVKTLGVVAGAAVATILGFRAVLAVMNAYKATMAVVTAAQMAYTAATYGAAGATYAGTAATTAQKVAMIAGAAAQKIATAAQWAFNAAMSANPIMLVVLAVAALIAGLVWFFTQTKLGQEIWANFTKFLGEAWANFSAGFKIVIDAIAQWWNDLWSGIVSFFQTMWAGFQVLFQAGILAFQIIWETVLGVIQTVWDAVWGGIKSFFVGIWNFIVAFVTTYITIVKTIITTVINVIMTVWSAVWGGIKSFFTTIWNGIVTGVKTYINTVRTIITTVVNVVKKVWSSVWGGISSFFSGIWNGIVNTVSKFSGTFKKVFGGIKGFVTSAFKGVVGVVKAPINGIIGLINGAIGALNNLSVTIPDWVPIVGGQTWGLSLPTIPKLASGAIVNTSPGGSLVNVGEGRYDEAVVPLGGPQFQRLADALADRVDSSTDERPVNVNVKATDPMVAARIVAEHLRLA